MAIQVAVTGAAGQIGYALLFRIASGEMFGPEHKVRLKLLELPEAVKAAEGTAMELNDCAFPLLEGVDCYDDANAAFEGVNWALLVGSMPRGPGMERSDLIKKNGPIFVAQGKALNRAANDLRVVVVGNPCNTNALIAQHNCREIAPTRFTAMTSLDENRAKAQLAEKTGTAVSEIKRMAIWGNHSSTMYPDYEQATISGAPVLDRVERDWLDGTFIPAVQKRGAAIIAARGKSSAASAASACVDHVQRFIRPTPEGDWFSAAIPSDGSHYQIDAGIICSFPLRSRGGEVEVVPDIKLSAAAQTKVRASVDELLHERSLVKDLL